MCVARVANHSDRASRPAGSEDNETNKEKRTNLTVMKISKSLMALLVSGAVGSTSVVAEHHLHQNPQHTGDIMQKVQVVEKDMIDKEFTANNLIGKDVYSSDGESIGKIHDIKLEGQQFAQLRMSFLQAQDGGWASETADRVDRSTDRAADRLERSADRTADRLDRTADRTADQLERTGERTQDQLVRDRDVERTADRTADRVERSADRTAENLERQGERIERQGERTAESLRESGERSAQGMQQRVGQQGQQSQQAQILAIVQTGGVLGIGADYFSVPLDQLNYNAEEERFQINLTEAQVEQLRERADQTSGL
jgi:hypothetical protein